MKRSWVRPLGVVILMVGACHSTYEEKDAVPSGVGIVVPEGNGQAVSEGEACSSIATAVSSAQSRLGCADAAAPACPSFIRPFGGEACLRYDKGTVDACSGIINGYKSCADLASKPCIVTALGRDSTCAAEDDAGADAQPDTSDSDAASDASSDAASDAATDAAKDAAKDAPAG